jgi:Tol biopolymer transport system component
MRRFSQMILAGQPAIFLSVFFLSVFHVLAEAEHALASCSWKRYTVGDVRAASDAAHMPKLFLQPGEDIAMTCVNLCHRQTIAGWIATLAVAALLVAGLEFALGGDGLQNSSPPDSPAFRLSSDDASCHFAKDDEKDEELEEFQTRLFVADADGSQMKPLADLPEYQAQGSPNWSQDGKYIAFDAWKPQDGEEFSASRVLVVNADGTKPRVLGPGAMPSFSPGGHRIVFSRPSVGGVWVMSSEGPDDELYPLDARAWGADWSPDGRVVYAVSLPGGANLVVHDFVEGHDTLLFDKQRSPYRQIFWNMAWSPDGKRIVFKGSTTDGKTEIGIVDARGEKFGFIRRYQGDVVPTLAWGAATKQILFIQQNPEAQRFQLFTLDPDTKLPPKVLPVLDPLRHYADIAYSPDGKKIVFSCQKRLPRN